MAEDRGWTENRFAIEIKCSQPCQMGSKNTRVVFMLSTCSTPLSAVHPAFNSKLCDRVCLINCVVTTDLVVTPNAEIGLLTPSGLRGVVTPGVALGCLTFVKLF